MKGSKTVSRDAVGHPYNSLTDFYRFSMGIMKLYDCRYILKLEEAEYSEWLFAVKRKKMMTKDW